MLGRGRIWADSRRRNTRRWRHRKLETEQSRPRHCPRNTRNTRSGSAATVGRETDGQRNRIQARVGSGSGGGNRWRLGRCSATAATKRRPPFRKHEWRAARRRRRRDYRDLPPVTFPRERMPDRVPGFLPTLGKPSWQHTPAHPPRRIGEPCSKNTVPRHSNTERLEGQLSEWTRTAGEMGRCVRGLALPPVNMGETPMPLHGPILPVIREVAPASSRHSKKRPDAGKMPALLCPTPPTAAERPGHV